MYNFSLLYSGVYFIPPKKNDKKNERKKEKMLMVSTYCLFPTDHENLRRQPVPHDDPEGEHVRPLPGHQHEQETLVCGR